MHNEGAVRILNIVTEESRVLASRERCPYLVRVEVADTNLRGNDSRLYASGAPGLGATIEEAMGIKARMTTEKNQEDEYGNYHIPPELFAPNFIKSNTSQSVTIEKEPLDDIKPKQMPRGGWQANDTVFYSHSPEDVYATNPYDAVRENEFKQLHHQMYNENGVVVRSSLPITEQRYVEAVYAN